MIRRYAQYKDSELEWIGEIPEGWEVKKLKYVASVKYGLGQPPREKSDGLPIIRATNVFRGKIDANNLVFVDPDDVPYDRDPILKENDIIVVRSGAYTADSAIVPQEFDGAVAGYDMVVRCNFVDSKFVSYCLLSDYVLKKQLLLHSLRAAQPHLNREELRETTLVLPPLMNQTAIASFLDRKTAEIDQLIANKTKLIALYEEEKTTIINRAVTMGLDPKAKTKPSGVDWLGDIPVHWELKKIKFLLKENKGALKTGPFGSQLKTSDMNASGEYKVYTQRNVLDNDYSKGDDRIDDDKFESLKEFEVFAGDILITTRGTIGKCSIFPEEAVRGVLHPCLIRIQIDNDIMLPPYITNYFNTSSFFLENVKLESNSTVIDVIYGYTLKEIVIPLPPVTEQIAIVAHIETECLRLDTIIDKFKKQIELFKEYRTTLISEVVTGKIDVRDEVAA